MIERPRQKCCTCVVPIPPAERVGHLMSISIAAGSAHFQRRLPTNGSAGVIQKRVFSTSTAQPVSSNCGTRRALADISYITNAGPNKPKLARKPPTSWAYVCRNYRQSANCVYKRKRNRLIRRGKAHWHKDGQLHKRRGLSGVGSDSKTRR